MVLQVNKTNRHLEYQRVYLPLCKVADTPFHIQGDEISYVVNVYSIQWLSDICPNTCNLHLALVIIWFWLLFLDLGPYSRTIYDYIDNRRQSGTYRMSQLVRNSCEESTVSCFNCKIRKIITKTYNIFCNTINQSPLPGSCSYAFSLTGLFGFLGWGWHLSLCFFQSSLWQSVEQYDTCLQAVHFFAGPFPHTLHISVKILNI